MNLIGLAYLVGPLMLLSACQISADEATSTPTSVRIGAIDWLTDFDEAARVSRANGKPLWMHFGENPG